MGQTPTTSTGVAAPALTIAATIAAGTAAYGAPVRFENDPFVGVNFNALDITMSAAAQAGGGSAGLTGTQVYLYYFADFYPTFSYQRTDTRGSGLEIWNSGFGNFYSAAFNSGELIGPGMTGGAWSQSSRLAFSYTSADRYYVPPTYVYPYGYYGGYYTYTNYMSGERGLLSPDGSQTYIGTRLTINGATHYGWIGVQNFNGYIEVFAWGYETEAGVGVRAGVPSPGAMAVVALGAAGALGRRKRAV